MAGWYFPAKRAAPHGRVVVEYPSAVIQDEAELPPNVETTLTYYDDETGQWSGEVRKDGDLVGYASGYTNRHVFRTRL